MKKYITTYFYHDCKDLGASYGNIFLPLEERNIVYWQTVYTFFFSSIACNQDPDVCFALFTNVKNFPHRDKIEGLGVKVYDDLTMSSRHSGKWATVKFFFDVVDYIANHQNFEDDDAFVMLDNDVVAVRSANPLFSYLDSQSNAIAYPFDFMPNKTHDFHGINLFDLSEFGVGIFGCPAKITRLIGGEFFCFRKDQANNLNNIFSALKVSNYLTTEEQILTLIDAHNPWCIFHQSIFRVWTTLKVFKVPKKNHEYIFLHLPSEKETGLNDLFNATKNMKASQMGATKFQDLFYQIIPLDRPHIIYLSKIIKLLRRITIRLR